MLEECFGELDHHCEIRIDDIADAHRPRLREDLPALPFIDAVVSIDMKFPRLPILMKHLT